MKMTRTVSEEFDEVVRTLTDERGKAYGHPADDFKKVQLIKEAIRGCPDDEIRHALEMIGVKMARLSETPRHKDSVFDIAGYARTIAMIIDRRTQEEELRLETLTSEATKLQDRIMKGPAQQ